jgi:hypothetical protein
VQALHNFSFERSRGIVWVCDLVNSAKYLNDNSCAGDLEEFLPRLHWTGMIATEAANGRFLKWTGDGFLAWFETPLYREIGQKAAAVFQAVWHLSFIVNVTQLAVKSSKRFMVRHGIAFEHDALLTNIKDAKGHEMLDITGRGVVLAFRLSGIPASFPGLVTDGSLLKSAREFGYKSTEFKSWIPSAEDRLRFFKGERYGTGNLYVSSDKTPRKKSVTSTLKHSKRLVDAVESKSMVPTGELDVESRFCSMMSNGPSWAKTAIAKEHQFIEKDMLGALKTFVTLAGKSDVGNRAAKKHVK